MLTIKRSCSNKIITQAIAYNDQPLTAILPQNSEDCIYSDSSEQLQSLLNKNPDAYIVFNQHPQARQRVESLDTGDRQVLLEIHQETRGVLGLEARYKSSGPGETLELVYQ